MTYMGTGKEALQKLRSLFRTRKWLVQSRKSIKTDLKELQEMSKNKGLNCCGHASLQAVIKVQEKHLALIDKQIKELA